MFWAVAARFAPGVWNISSDTGPSGSWCLPKLRPRPGVVPMGVEGTRKGMRAQIDGDKPSSLAELALFLPVQIIDPEVHHLIEEGPSRRRRFLDWGVFHVEQSFVGHWQRYQQVLKQRNAALKAHQPRAVVSVWDSDLVRSGEQLGAARARYVSLVSPIAEGIARNLLGLELSLSYRSGWLKGQSMAEALQQSWNHDVDMGATQVGPHRAELGIRLGRNTGQRPHFPRSTKTAGGSLTDCSNQIVSRRFTRAAHPAAR